MPIWKLEPVDPDDDLWSNFSHSGAVIVRARDGTAARAVAEVKLAPLWGPLPGSLHGTSPWQYLSLSSCQRFEDSGYEEDGPDELLHPLGK